MKNVESKIEVISGFWDAHPNFRDLILSPERSREFFEEHDALIKRLHPDLDKILDYPGCLEKAVLEIGCGMGRETAKISEFAKKTVGVDLSLKSLLISRERFKILRINTPAILLGSDCQKLPFKSNIFDRIYANGVIHHAQNVQQAVDEIFRVLKDGGDAIIQVSHKNSIFYYLQVLTFIRLKYSIVKAFPRNFVKLLRIIEPDILEIKELVDKEKWAGIEDLSLRVTDGRNNPATGQVYSKKTARLLFNKFPQIKFIVRGRRDNVLDRAAFLEKRFGFYLYIYLKK